MNDHFFVMLNRRILWVGRHISAGCIPSESAFDVCTPGRWSGRSRNATPYIGPS